MAELEFRIDPDNPERFVHRLTIARVWTPSWTRGRYLSDEDVAGWVRLVPAPLVEHRCVVPAPFPPEGWSCPDCPRMWTVSALPGSGRA